jgi:hypothetical protein
VKTFFEARGQTLELEIVKRAAATSIRRRKWISGHCGKVGLLQNERRDGTQSRNCKCRSIDHSRNFWPHQPEDDDGDIPGPTGTQWGNHSGRAALRREQLKSKDRENRATRRKVRPITDVSSTVLRK